MKNYTVKKYCEENNLQHLLEEWNYDKNKNIDFLNASYGSGKKGWWKCNSGHEWQSTIKDRLKGRQCPYCTGRLAIKGVNDLETKCPELAKEWNYQKNENLKPSDVKPRSNAIVWWICEHGHEWESSVYNRSGKNKRGCPYCSNKKALKGYNDLATSHPYISKEWHPTKNGDLKPEYFVSGSNKKVWWICEHGHEWESVIVSRCGTMNTGCPYCNGKKAIVGFNDFQSHYPEIAKEWHPTKNGNLKPSNVTKKSGKKVWWLCDHGHEWEEEIFKRACKKTSLCPCCASEKTNDKLKKYNHYKEEIENVVKINNVDMLKPELMKEWNYAKNGELNPNKVSLGSNKKIWWVCEHGHEWETTVNNRVSRKTSCPICSNKKILIGYNDLGTTHPELLKEWHPYKNKNLKPTEVMSGSRKKVWWLCEHGHEWEAFVYSRTGKRASGCPYCSGNKILTGFNDLATLYPSISKEWCTKKNNADLVNKISPGSNLKVWWICEKGHHWKASPASRIGKKVTNCPYCQAERKKSFPELSIYFYIKKIFADAISGYRQFDNIEIDIYIPSLKLGIEYDGYYWHRKKINEDLNKNKKLSSKVKLLRVRENGLPLMQDNLSVNYIREDNYSNESLEKSIKWVLAQLKVYYGLSRDKCKYIESLKIDIRNDEIDILNMIDYIEKQKSLFNMYPELTKEWHPTKNGKIQPKHMYTGSHRKVWWICEHGHEWASSIANRVWGNGCPYCANQKVLEGYNDLATTHPELSREWHPTKNEELKPTKVPAGSNKKVWWLCEHGHEWEARINKRSGKYQRGCPYCCNQKIIPGYNDFESKNPELAKEWHPTKNGDLEPSHISPVSGRKVWWICKYGHSYESVVANRLKGVGCSVCVNRKILKGYNDLATTHPELSREWHPTKNEYKTASDVIAGSSKKVWWVCEHGHEWEATISSRSRGSGCPYCYNLRRCKNFDTLN